MWHRTDTWLGGAAIVTLLLWGINVWVASLFLLYLNLIVLAGVFAYGVWKGDPHRQLRNAWMIGMVACLVYAYIDSLLSNLRFAMIFFLKPGLWRPFGSTPLVLILLWGCFITLVLYFYQRVRALWPSVYPALLLTAGGILLAGLLFEWLGEAAGIWTWNSANLPSGGTGTVRWIVSLSYAFAGLFAPYVLKNPFIGGLRCGVVVGVLRFGSLVLIRYLGLGA